MRLITYERQGTAAPGAWIDGDSQVVNLADAAVRVGGSNQPAYTSIQALIEAGRETWDSCRSIINNPPSESVFPAAECRILAPLPQPIQLRDSLCFEGHLLNIRRTRGEAEIAAAADPDAKRAELEASKYFEMDPSFYEFPVYYNCNRMSVIGNDVDIRWPNYSCYIDFELEWAAVIGKTGLSISRENASEYIFGYTIFNDWSARDEQMRAMSHTLNCGPGGGKDFANGIGPCIVTADEIPDPYNLSMKARVNGTEISNGTSADMYWKFEDLVVLLSRGNPLYAGELIGSGTVPTGCMLETGTMLSPGDLLELEVEKIGILRNRVVAPHMRRSPQNGPR